MADMGHIARVVISGKLDGQVTNNVMHFGTDAAVPDWTALANAIIACIISAFKPMAGDNWSLDHVSVTPIFPAAGDEIITYPTAAVNGTGLPALPGFNAALIRIQTGQGGRTHRGRIFLPGVVANDVVHGQYTDNGLAKVIAFAACLAAKFIFEEAPDATVFKLGVLSRKGLTTATAAAHFTRATTLQPQRIIATMHSRKLGVGV